MHVDLAAQPAYAIAYIRLAANEEVEVERGAMVAMSAAVEVSTTTGGGVARAAMRKMVGQENFFLARYRSRVDGGWVAVAPRFPGDIVTVDIQPGADLLVQTGAFLAHSAGIETDMRFGGLGSVAQREGAALIHASGDGQMLLCSYGGIQRFDLGGEKLIVDTGHLLAFSAGMAMRIGPLSSILTSQLSGEGLVAEITGPGVVYIQTRAEQALRSWLMPEREQNTK